MHELLSEFVAAKAKRSSHERLYTEVCDGLRSYFNQAQPSCRPDAAEMQPRCSRDAAEMQPRCSRRGPTPNPTRPGAACGPSTEDRLCLLQALGAILLYKFERRQLQQLRSEKPDVPLVEAWTVVASSVS